MCHLPSAALPQAMLRAFCVPSHASGEGRGRHHIKGTSRELRDAKLCNHKLIVGIDEDDRLQLRMTGGELPLRWRFREKIDKTRTAPLRSGSCLEKTNRNFVCFRTISKLLCPIMLRFVVAYRLGGLHVACYGVYCRIASHRHIGAAA